MRSTLIATLTCTSLAFASRDSLIVQDFLDTNGLRYYRVSQVVTEWHDSSVVALDMDYLLDQNTFCGAIWVFPAYVCSLTALEHFGLRRSLATNLPDEIGSMGYLRSLDISENYLTSLPEEITQLTCSISVAGNRLYRDSISSGIAAWLDAHAEAGWDTVQYDPFRPVQSSPAIIAEARRIPGDAFWGCWQEKLLDSLIYLSHEELEQIEFRGDSFFVRTHSWTDYPQPLCVPECMGMDSVWYGGPFAAGRYDVSDSALVLNGAYTNWDFRVKTTGCSGGSHVYGDFVRSYQYHFSNDTLYYNGIWGGLPVLPLLRCAGSSSLPRHRTRPLSRSLCPSPDGIDVYDLRGRLLERIPANGSKAIPRNLGSGAYILRSASAGALRVVKF